MSRTEGTSPIRHHNRKATAKLSPPRKNFQYEGATEQERESCILPVLPIPTSSYMSLRHIEPSANSVSCRSAVLSPQKIPCSAASGVISSQQIYSGLRDGILLQFDLFIQVRLGKCVIA